MYRGFWEVVPVTPRGQKKFSTRLLPVTGAVLALALGGCAASAESTPDAFDGQPGAQPNTSSGQPSPGQEVGPGTEGSTQRAAEGIAGDTRTTPAESTTPPKSTTPEQDTTSGDRTTPQEPRLERCHTSMLAGELDRVEPGAGQRYTELKLTNTSAQSCTLYGYGGMELVGSDGSALPTSVERGGSPGPSLITLAPDESASSTLHWSVVPSGDEPAGEQCQADPTHANVTPPDEEDSLTVPWSGGPVCDEGTINASAYHQ